MRFERVLLAVLVMLSLAFHTTEASASQSVVLEVNNIQAIPKSMTDSGTARVSWTIKDGPLQGKTFVYEHQLWGNPNYDPPLRQAQTFVGSITIENGSVQRLELGQVRKDYTLLALFAFLSVALFVIAGWEGITGLVCSFFTLATILYGFFPLALNATGVLWSGVTICLLTIFVTIPLILKGTKPVIPSIISLTFTTGILFMVTRWGMDFLNLSPERARHSRLIISHLNRVVENGTMALTPILTTGIVIGTLGAMMDVSVVISSTINEITRDKDSITFRSGFQSGITVGREILSTMVNTLIFAYLSVLLPLFLAYHVFELSFIRFVNYPFVGIEILRIATGLFGLSLIIPTTALLSAWWSR